jgi:hypothetical protein
VRYIVISASKGVYLGGYSWEKDNKGGSPIEKTRVPCWSPGRIALVLKDLSEIHGLDDLRAGEVEGKDGAKNVSYEAVKKAGFYSNLVGV